MTKYKEVNPRFHKCCKIRDLYKVKSAVLKDVQRSPLKYPWMIGSYKPPINTAINGEAGLRMWVIASSGG